MMTFQDRIADVWPANRPLPTDQQLDEAAERLRKQDEENRAAGYQGDWGFSLSFTMLTYARFTWWHLFFPDEKIDPPILRFADAVLCTGPRG